MFTGASQFAMVGVIGAGGSVWAGAATAALLGTRNALYGVRLSSLLGAKGLRGVASAHFVIDETTAMAIARDNTEDLRCCCVRHSWSWSPPPPPPPRS